MNRDLLKLACTGLLVTLGVSAWSQANQTIISTFPNYDGNAFSLTSGQQIGDQIFLNQSDYSLTGFQFEYITPNAFLSTAVGVNISFYANTGPNGSPAAVPFYESGWFYNNPGGSIPAYAVGEDLVYTTADFQNGDGAGSIVMPAGFLMPTEFTFTVEFTNIDSPGLSSPVNGTVSVPIGQTTNLYPSTVVPAYWVNNNGAWSELTNSVGNNLLFSFTGVPEPSIMALSGIGSLLLVGAIKLKRKR